MKLAFFGWLGLKSIKSFGSTASDWADIIIIIGSINLDFRTFLLEAIEANSEMMSNFFSFEGERDERQRCPTGRARICRRLNSSVRNKSNK